MSLELFLGMSARVSVVLALALVVAWSLRRSSAAVRRWLLAVALVSALLVPALGLLLPSVHVQGRVADSLAVATQSLDPIVSDAAGAPAPPATVSPKPAVRATRIELRSIVMGVWGLGAAFVLARVLLAHARVRRIVQRSSKRASLWDEVVRRAGVALGARAKVRRSTSVSAPFVTGIFDPVVIVPAEGDTWEESRRLSVALHELAHVKQRDALVQVIAQLASALHWFNPLVWIVARRLRFERELAADDVVLAHGTKASDYAADLLSIASSAWEGSATSAVGFFQRSELPRRVEALLSRSRERGTPSTRTSIAILVRGGALATLVACASASHTPASGAPATGATAGTPALQAVAEEELERLARDSRADAATIVILDPTSGAILANAGIAAGKRADVAVQSSFVTGSTLKAVTLASALETNALDGSEQLDCEGGSFTYDGKTMRDAGAYGTLPLADVLAVSSNVGFTKVFDRLGGKHLGDTLRAFHFDAPTTIADHSYEGATIAIGEAVKATPLQVAAAYAVFANGGYYVTPSAHGDGARERVIRPETAAKVLALLAAPVNAERGTAKRAKVEGVQVAGKTGTATSTSADGSEGVYASFVGIVPADAPKYVILVAADRPKGDVAGGVVAAPVFARVAKRILK
jgi:beta-lactamase regulating signal transducer with metallopeptidase domain